MPYIPDRGAAAAEDPGQARLAALLSGRRINLALVGAGFTAVFLTAIVLQSLGMMAATGAPAVPTDFGVFWAAARLVLAGTPLSAFDMEALRSFPQLQSDRWLPFAYPPGFLAAMTPFGLLPFAAAWLLFVGLSGLAMAAALRAHARGLPLICLALAPAFLPAAILGQTSLLWGAGLVAALTALGRGRQVEAGIFIGLLTLKPRLGPLLPVALLACGAWPAIAAATLTAMVVHGAATLVFGIGYWGVMAEMMMQHSATLRAQAADVELMFSPYVVLRGLGLEHGPALSLQAAAGVLAAMAAWRVWRWADAGPDLRAGVLIAAIPVATPYLWHYEGALMALAALFLVRAGAIGTGPGGALLAALLWLGPAPAIVAEMLTGAGVAVPVRALVAPVLALGFVVALIAAFKPLGAGTRSA